MTVNFSMTGDLSTSVSEITEKRLTVGKHFNLKIHHGDPAKLQVKESQCSAVPGKDGTCSSKNCDLNL